MAEAVQRGSGQSSGVGHGPPCLCYACIAKFRSREERCVILRERQRRTPWGRAHIEAAEKDLAAKLERRLWGRGQRLSAWEMICG